MPWIGRGGIRAPYTRGNTCAVPSLTKNGFFQSVSAIIRRSQSENQALPTANGTDSTKVSSVATTDAPEPIKIHGLESIRTEVVRKPPSKDTSKKAIQVRRIGSSAGLQAGSVLKRKTENLKEIYRLGKKLGQG